MTYHYSFKMRQRGTWNATLESRPTVANLEVVGRPIYGPNFDISGTAGEIARVFNGSAHRERCYRTRLKPKSAQRSEC